MHDTGNKFLRVGICAHVPLNGQLSGRKHDVNFIVLTCNSEPFWRTTAARGIQAIFFA